MKHTISVLCLLLYSLKFNAQSIEQKKVIAQEVFDKIVQSCGNSGRAPLLSVIPREEGKEIIARYVTGSRPIVEIDEKLVDICLSFKTERLHALAIILGHELAHHYKQHRFCQDLAYAAKKNSSLKKNYTKYFSVGENQTEKENDADVFGFFYACAAGYKPFGIFSKLINKIYSQYDLQDAIKGYPSKKQRIASNEMSQKNANDLFTIFTTGKILTSSQNYDEAVECFHYVNDQFKSRENFNNAGVALLLQALNSKTKNFKEFIYPIELDPVSRLNSSTTRGATEITNYRRLLALAKKEFKFAYNLDDSYTEALINLAYVSLLEGNPLVAVQEYIPLIIPDDTIKYANKINLVKAIAYFETDTLKSATYFNMIFSGKDSIMDYDRTLFTLRNDRGGNLLNNYKNEWGKRNAIPQLTEEQLRTFNKGNLQKSRNIYPDLHSDDMEKITIAASDDKNLIRVLLNDKELLTAIRYNDSNEWIIQPKEAGLKVNNSTLKKPMVIKL